MGAIARAATNLASRGVALRSRSHQHASAISTERETSEPSRAAIAKKTYNHLLSFLPPFTHPHAVLKSERQRCASLEHRNSLSAKHIFSCALLSVKKTPIFPDQSANIGLFFPCEPGCAVTRSYLRRPLDALYLRYTASAPTEQRTTSSLSGSYVALCGRLT